MKTGRKSRSILLLVLSLLVLMGVPAVSYGAAGDPTLRFDLTTADATTDLQAGDSVKVEVVMSRADRSAEEYKLYGVQLDIKYDQELFRVSELKTSGLKRPDGENWKGSWSCREIPAANDTKRVRVLCTNMGLAVNLSNVDRLSGEKLTDSQLCIDRAEGCTRTEQRRGLCQGAVHWIGFKKRSLRGRNGTVIDVSGKRRRH